MAADMTEITRLLVAHSEGDRAALDSLMPRVYERLHQIAHRHLRKERSGHTFHTTDLVHEAYLGLVDHRQVSWQGRLHFFALASRVMRNILIDYARARSPANGAPGPRSRFSTARRSRSNNPPRISSRSTRP